MDKLDILINKIAQSKIPLEKGIETYDQGDEELKKQIISFLSFNLSQAKVTDEQIRKGITNSPIKITTDRVEVVVTAYEECYFKYDAIGRVYNLNEEEEAREACIVLLAIFREADTYRRNKYCKNGCSHWWHNLE